MNRFIPSRFAGLLAYLLLTLAVSACGFRLQGYEPLPSQLRQLQLQMQEPRPRWDTELKRQLVNNGVTLSSDAPLVLRISDITETQRIASYTTTTKVAEYITETSLHYRLESATGRRLFADNQVRRERLYRFDSARLVGKEAEVSLIRQELRKEVIRSLLLQLQQIDFSRFSEPEPSAESDAATCAASPTQTTPVNRTCSGRPYQAP